MEKRELTCIGCPLGCGITVELDEGEILSVSGYTCKRGEIYARKEVTNPTRNVTSTVRVTGGERERVSCKTRGDVPKALIFSVMEEINRASVAAPVCIGDVLIGNVAGSGIDVVATANIKAV